MSLIQIRKRLLTVETIHHEGGPPAAVPLRMAAACAVVRNPYAGRYEPDLLPFMAELRALGRELAEGGCRARPGPRQAYGKGAIVGVNGELEHGAVWHEAGAGRCARSWGNPRPSCRLRKRWHRRLPVDGAAALHPRGLCAKPLQRDGGRRAGRAAAGRDLVRARDGRWRAHPRAPGWAAQGPGVGARRQR